MRPRPTVGYRVGDHTSRRSRLLKDFKEFLVKGNLVGLAVAFVIGLAFAAVVTSLVEDIVTPLIAAIGGEPSFQDLTFTINNSTFTYGQFLNALITFVIIAAVVFFLIVRPYQKFTERLKREEAPDPTIRACPQCTSEISAAATRCPFCTAEIAPTAPA